MIGVVFRRFGQFVALVGLVAFAFNAQCALLCSMQPLRGTASHRADIDQPVHSGHPCCPGKKAPNRGKEDQRQPCSDPMLAIGGSDFATVTHVVSVTPHFDAAPVGWSGAFEPLRRAVPLVRVVSSGGPQQVPAFSVIRI
jgi:hypothetical protein